MKLGVLVLSLAACASHEATTSTSVELPQQLPTPVATVSIALSQKHDAPPRTSVHKWTPPVLKQPPDVTQARKYFMRGVQQYDAGNYAQALIELETAWSYSAHNAVLFNIATALERVGRVEEAIDVYERFADTHPPSEAEVRKKIDALRKAP